MEDVGKRHFEHVLHEIYNFNRLVQETPHNKNLHVHYIPIGILCRIADEIFRYCHSVIHWLSSFLQSMTSKEKQYSSWRKDSILPQHIFLCFPSYEASPFWLQCPTEQRSKAAPTFCRAPQRNTNFLDHPHQTWIITLRPLLISAAVIFPFPLLLHNFFHIGKQREIYNALC